MYSYQICTVGDFNAHHSDWEDQRTDLQGEYISRACEDYHLVIMNDGSPTFMSSPNVPFIFNYRSHHCFKVPGAARQSGNYSRFLWPLSGKNNAMQYLFLGIPILVQTSSLIFSTFVNSRLLI